jgi:hypothetical protein
MIHLLRLFLAIAVVAPAHAQNAVTPFTDGEGVPNPKYLRFDAGGAMSNGCQIENTQDHSKMSCKEWFDRYCPLPKMRANANCTEVERIVVSI